jgi:hypothetical protein
MSIVGTTTTDTHTSMPLAGVVIGSQVRTIKRAIEIDLRRDCRSRVAILVPDHCLHREHSERTVTGRNVC